jgi:hypothetical protein
MGGRKLWVVGEEFIQADLQGFLGDQIHAVFANASARDSQWPAPPEGSTCYLTTANQQQEYRGSAWRNVPWLYRSVVTGAAGAFANTEAILFAGIIVPSIATPHRIRVNVCQNYGWSATGGTIDTHIRYNTTGAGAVVGDTLLRQHRIHDATTVGQTSVSIQAAVDRSGGSTTVSVWGITDGFTVTVGADATLAQFEVRAELQ